MDKKLDFNVSSSLMAISRVGDVSLSSAERANKLVEFQAELLRKIEEVNIEEDALISFSAGGKRFLVSALEISAIHDVPNITPVPAVQGWMIGVASVVGEVCTVTDFSQFIGSAPIDQKNYKSKLIIPRWDNRTAILVDNVYHLVPKNTIAKTEAGSIQAPWAGDVFFDRDGNEIGMEIGLQALLSDNSFLNANIVDDVPLSAK